MQFPRLAAVRPRREMVWCPKCRPPRRKTVKTGCCGRGGLRFGHIVVVGTKRGAGQVARLSETPVAFARWYLCGSETAITFAGEKWAFLVDFPRAEVMPVSRVPCWGRAVVLVVSTSPCFCVLDQVLCAIFFALRGAHDVEMRKSSPCSALRGCEREKVRPASPKWPKNAVFRCVGRVFSRESHWMPRAGRTFSRKCHWGPVLGELFRGGAAERGLLGDLFRGRAAGPHGVGVVSLQSLRPPLIPAMSSTRQTCGASAVVAVTARQRGETLRGFVLCSSGCDEALQGNDAGAARPGLIGAVGEGDANR